MSAVIFRSKDYYDVMASQCRRTIVGRTLKILPQIDVTRSIFSKKFSLKGSVKIGIYDTYNIFPSFTNDEDINTILYKKGC